MIRALIAAHTRLVGSLLGVACLAVAGVGCTDSRLMQERAAYHAENTELQAELQRAYAARDAMAVEVRTLQAENANLRASGSSQPAPVAVAPDAGANQFAGIPGIEIVPGSGGEVTVRVPGDVLFAAGKVDLKSSSKRTLGQIAGVLKSEYAGSTIRVEGYTDSDPIRKSKWKDNLQLSMERAAAVHRFLVEQGVPEDDLYSAGFGPAKPQGTKAKSRRVEIVVVKSGG
ncbi:MAG: OmpA family protein [Planctomycetota bacterium]